MFIYINAPLHTVLYYKSFAKKPKREKRQQYYDSSSEEEEDDDLTDSSSSSGFPGYESPKKRSRKRDDTDFESLSRQMSELQEKMNRLRRK